MASGRLQTGWAVGDITPRIGTPLIGYGFFLARRAVGVADPLYVRAVAVIDDEPVVILALDILGLDSLMAGRLKNGITARTGIPKERIMLTSTHTHTGPSTILLRGDLRRRGRYLRQVVEQAEQVSEEAIERAQRVKRSATFCQRFAGFTRNRAFADGAVSSHVHGLVFGTNTRTVALANYGCHPVTLGGSSEISADYPGVFNQLMGRAGVSSIFLTGPSGDLDPIINKDTWVPGTKDYANRYGGSLAKAALEGISSSQRLDADKIQVGCASFRTRYQIPTRDDVSEVLARAHKVEEDPKNRARFEISWALDTLRLLESGRYARSATLSVQAFRIGKAVILALPGEVFFEFGEAIRRSLPMFEILIPTNANSVVGYIPSRRDFEAGGYASGLSCKLYRRFPFELDVGEKLVDRSVELVRSLAG